MKKFVFSLILTLLFLLPTESFAYQYQLKNSGQGFCYSYRNECFQYFTQDQEFKLPQDKKVAEERFKRRKEYVEKWYLEYRPWDLNSERHNWFIEVPATILCVATFPVCFGVAEWLDDKHRSSPKEIERVRQSNIRYEKACEEMREFIIQDSRFEMEAK